MLLLQFEVLVFVNDNEYSDCVCMCVWCTFVVVLLVDWVVGPGQF